MRCGRWLDWAAPGLLVLLLAAAGWLLAPGGVDPAESQQRQASVLGTSAPAPGGKEESTAPSPRVRSFRAPGAPARDGADAGGDSIPGDEGAAVAPWPGWATGPTVPAMASLEWHAPDPHELPCGTTDCLTADPQRFRAELHTMMAHEGLQQLVQTQGLDEQASRELQAQLAANLQAMSAQPSR